MNITSISPVSRTNFGLKFDRYMQEELDKDRVWEYELRSFNSSGLLELKKWELAQKMLKASLSDDYTLCLVPTGITSYDFYLTSDKFNGYENFLCKKLNKREVKGILSTKQLDQLTERIKALKAVNFKDCGPTICVKDEKQIKHK